MSDELLSFYNRELAYIRKSAAQFAAAHPKIATRLRLGTDSTEDPHVERLIEAFAYLNARTRLKIEDDFPELTESLLGILYPHYQNPIPSMAIVQFELDPAQNEITAGYRQPAQTPIETEPIQGVPCKFQSCYPVTLWPIDVKLATLKRFPYKSPQPAVKAAAVIHLSLQCRSKGVKFADFDPGNFRFYLKGAPQHAYPLYELIFNNVVAIALANDPEDRSPVWLDTDAIRSVGFESDEGLLPYPKRSFLGYRLLTEFFTFPDKFRFVEISGITKSALKNVGQKLEIYLYLNRSITDLEPNVTADTFRLGCSPIVNLFRQRAEPIALTQMETEYRVIPDARRQSSFEVYSVEKVLATNPGGRSREFFPFFSVRHGRDSNTAATYWHSTRRPAEQSSQPQQAQTAVDHGTEIFLTLVDLDFQAAEPADKTMEIELTCLNRDLPGRLPFGGDQPRLQITEGGAMISRVICLTPPTRTQRPALRHGTIWRLISHLSLNHLSLVGGEDGAEALREILRLYDFSDSAETRSIIDGILKVESRHVAGRVGGKGGSICRGVEATIQFDPDRFTGSGLFLFAAVLERFLALYSNLNSFSRLVATIRGREGELRRWQPRLGERMLL